MSHAVGDNLGALIDLHADWAAVRGQDLFYSQGGRLLHTRPVRTGGQLGCEPPVEAADFTAIRFQRVVSPD